MLFVKEKNKRGTALLQCPRIMQNYAYLNRLFKPFLDFFVHYFTYFIFTALRTALVAADRVVVPCPR